MARVFLTGGAGYVGSHVTKRLVKAGHEVTLFDNLSTGFRELARYGRFVEGDLFDAAALRRTVVECQPEVVMHFAAKALVGESMADPMAYYSANVAGTLTLLSSFQALATPPAFIFSSTCSIYGATESPVSELDAIAPMNPYARSKRMVEEMLADYESAFGMRYISLRYFNAAGCDPDGELGELHEPETHLIPRLLLHALNPKGYPVAVHGSDYPTEDGTCIRDYVHVDDLAEAHLLAMDRLLGGGDSDIFNLGTARGASVREVIQVVEKVTGRSLEVTEGPRRAGDPPRLMVGSRKAREVLGWAPTHDLESIVRTAWSWTKARRA
jgi:UDP-glucose-4-epimerase GalE